MGAPVSSNFGLGLLLSCSNAMVSILEQVAAPFRALRRLGPLLALIGAVAVVAGCGGGGKTSDEGTNTTAAFRDFDVRVSSRTKATITLTLEKPTKIGLVVKRLVGSSGQKVGRVKFGQKPAGHARLIWNLRVNNKPLPAGRYEVEIRNEGGPGASKPKTITVP